MFRLRFFRCAKSIDCTAQNLASRRCKGSDETYQQAGAAFTTACEDGVLERYPDDD